MNHRSKTLAPSKTIAIRSLKKDLRHHLTIATESLTVLLHEFDGDSPKLDYATVSNWAKKVQTRLLTVELQASRLDRLGAQRQKKFSHTDSQTENKSGNKAGGLIAVSL